MIRDGSSQVKLESGAPPLMGAPPERPPLDLRARDTTAAGQPEYEPRSPATSAHTVCYRLGTSLLRKHTPYIQLLPQQCPPLCVSQFPGRLTSTLLCAGIFHQSPKGWLQRSCCLQQCLSEQTPSLSHLRQQHLTQIPRKGTKPTVCLLHPRKTSNPPQHQLQCQPFTCSPTTALRLSLPSGDPVRPKTTVRGLKNDRSSSRSQHLQGA